MGGRDPAELFGLATPAQLNGSAAAGRSLDNSHPTSSSIVVQVPVQV